MIDVQYIRGADNVVADCLSRPALSVEVDVWDLPALASAQSTDPEIQAARPRLKAFIISGEHPLLCDTSSDHPRPFVPSALRRVVFNNLHQISHPGVNGSLRLVKARYFWPSLDRDIKSWVKYCTECQRAKVHRHTKPPMQPFSEASGRFETVHIDLIGPLPEQTPPAQPGSVPFRYVLTCVDRATRWVEAQPLCDITAESVAGAFVEIWISRFGVPIHVVTDRGRQFEAELFHHLAKVIGFHRLRTTAYHPQGNGMIERRHRVIKSAIMARGQSWLAALPVVLLGLRMLPAGAGMSPFSAVTGTELLCPRIAIDREASSGVQTSFVRELARHMTELDFRRLSDGVFHGGSRVHLPTDLDTCSHVWLRIDRIRHALEAPYQGPFRVVRRGSHVFTLELPSGSTETVSISRVKPAYLPDVRPAADRRPVPVSPRSPMPVDCPEAQSSHSQDQSAKSADVARPSHRSRAGRTVRFRHKPDYFYF